MANPSQEEKNTSQSAEQTTRKIAEETSRVSRRMAEVSERAARANAEMMTDQAETAHQMWQSGSELASRLAARSADQFARALGIGGDEAQDATLQLSRNLTAIMQSSGVLTHGVRAFSIEWVELMRKRIERSLDHMNAFTRCRTPHDLAAAQSDALRDHLEGMIEGTRKIAQISVQTADEASRKVTENVERVRRAA